MKSLEKLIQKLNDELLICIEFEEDLDCASWNRQQGVLITPNEARMIITLYEQLKSLT